MTKKLIALILALFMMLGFVGCGQKGQLYGLEEAYEAGLLTVEDLQVIAEYHKNKSSCAGKLSKRTEKAIKKAAFDRFQETVPNLTAHTKTKDIIIDYYYGTYNNCAVIMIDVIGWYTVVGFAYTIEIGGVSFSFTPDLGSEYLLVWQY